MKEGKSITDEDIVTLITKRVSMYDCISNGWVLDGFPANLNQCHLLNNAGISPNCVFKLNLS
jgi:hypothetical protein